LNRSSPKEAAVSPKRVAEAVIIACLAVAGPVAADDPWFITEPVVLTDPVELGDVVVLSGGSLTVRDMPEPGLRMRGSLGVVGNGWVRFENSVIQFLSVYHGQYLLAGAENARIDIVDCDYRVPNGVQHALMAAGNTRMLIENTDFGTVQLLSANTGRLVARRLTGNFEVLVQDDSTMILEDIPRVAGEGKIWVWVEFSAGSVAEYSPPMPGMIEHWFFPPPGSTGISQTVTVDQCEVLLWPMLVREGSEVTLRDIPEDNRVAVGFHLPNDTVVEGLVNNRSYADDTVDFPDRTFRLVNASIDTWNLYPQADAHVTVRDSLLGEILSLEYSRVSMERTTIDGTGGYLGARGDSGITATDCIFTCTIEATQQSTIALHSSTAAPNPSDPTGAFTRFGAYDDGRLFSDQTAVLTTPVLAGRGLIAVSYVQQPPAAPTPGDVALIGAAAQYSLDPEIAAGSWRIAASSRSGDPPVIIGGGTYNVENEVLGVWSDADPGLDYRLQTTLTDGLGRTLVGNIVVPGSNPRVR
jgi:hypothetical protein